VLDALTAEGTHHYVPTVPSPVVLAVLVAGALLVGGCALYVGFSYFYAFVIRRPNAPNTQRAHLFRAALVELGATLVLMPLWPLWLLLGATYQATHEGEDPVARARRPVVLLHGFAMNRTNWLWVGRRLAQRGVGPLYGATYFSPQSVRASAQKLKGFVERTLAREDAGRVDIVAHSLGGVVARYYIERLGGARRVGRLVTIGSPHRGTLLGRLGLVPSAHELVAGSPLLDELGQPDPNVEYTSVWSRADAIVIPPESASIAPAGRDQIFDDLGHLSMLLSPRVIEAVAARLAPIADDRGRDADNI
jgi:triacylglycerol esterase/lipase EstA (alpha/beta hydrolase family)